MTFGKKIYYLDQVIYITISTTDVYNDIIKAFGACIGW